MKELQRKWIRIAMRQQKMAQVRDELNNRYHLVVEDEDQDLADSVAAQLAEGIHRLEGDFCKKTPYCEGNKGIPRIQMPVIEPDQVADFVRRLKEGLLDTKNPPPRDKATIEYLTSGDQKRDKVRVTRKSVPVTQLKATQKEINASKASGMAQAALLGKFNPGKSNVLASQDGYIADGHHRWAALQILARLPRITRVPQMNTVFVGLPVDTFIRVANAYTDAIGNQRKAF